jgi:hypothetical protein
MKSREVAFGAVRSEWVTVVLRGKGHSAAQQILENVK